jgi:hypothetical protein
MICQYCGHKLTDGKCLNPACPGKLRRESMSELKCIYWKNATPDDFINARLGETWIQGIGEVDTFYAEDLVHNFGKAWKEKLTLADALAEAAEKAASVAEITGGKIGIHVVRELRAALAAYRGGE